MPGRGRDKSHSAPTGVPYWNHGAGEACARCVLLQEGRLLCLLLVRQMSEGLVHRDDDHVLALLMDVCNIEVRHCVSPMEAQSGGLAGPPYRRLPAHRLSLGGQGSGP